MASHSYGGGLATQTGALDAGSSQFADPGASQLDPTAHGADYGFLDFTQQDSIGTSGAAHGGSYQFTSFSQASNLHLSRFKYASRHLHGVARACASIPINFVASLSKACPWCIGAHDRAQHRRAGVCNARRMSATGETAGRRPQPWCASFSADTSRTAAV